MNLKILPLPLVFLLTACITDQNTGLNPKVVQDTIVAHYPSIQNCYTQSIGPEGHAGIIKADFVIDKEGRAKDIRMTDESLGTDKVNACLKTELSAIAFPKPKGGVNVKVSYPFKFEADKTLTQSAVVDVLKRVNTSRCYNEIAALNNLKVKITIGKQGRVKRSTLAEDASDLKKSSPCLSRILMRQKFPKISSKLFQSVSVVVTFQADAVEKISQAR